MADENRQERPQTNRQWQSWNDARLDELAATVRLLGSTVTTVAVHSNMLAEATDDRMELRRWVSDVESRLVKSIERVAVDCETFQAEYREDAKAARQSNRTLVVAVVAGSATVFAAIIAAIATILTSSGHG